MNLKPFNLKALNPHKPNEAIPNKELLRGLYGNLKEAARRGNAAPSARLRDQRFFFVPGRTRGP